VLETQTSPGPAIDITLEPTWTAMPPTFGPMTSTSPHVDARPDLDAEAWQGLGKLDGTRDGPAGLVEGGEKAIAGGIELASPVLPEGLADQRVVLGQQLTPPAVAQLRGQSGRSHDVRKQDRGEAALWCSGPLGHRR
jgi:hypothetical protein